MTPTDAHMQEMLRQKEQREAAQIQWAIELLVSIEKAVLGDSVARMGAIDEDLRRHRVDNAVKIYCAEFLKK
jgi:hypothetical protein